MKKKIVMRNFEKKMKGDVVFLGTVLFGEGKRRWHGTENVPDPEYLRWVSDPDAEYPSPRERLKQAGVVPAKSSGRFDMEMFRELGTQAERLGYLRSNSMWLGTGSSRIVFAISPKMVIKLAGGRRMDDGGVDNPGTLVGNMMEAGKYQNVHEYGLWEKYGRSDVVGRLLPRSFDIADDGSWLLSELVRPLRDEEEFRELVGMDEDDFHRLMRVLGEHGHMNSEYFRNFVGGLRRKVETGFGGWDDETALTRDEVEGARRGLQFLETLERLKGLVPGLRLNEMVDVSAWGKGSDGRLVLLDAGGDETLLKRYYGD